MLYEVITRGIEFNLIDDIECIIAKKIDPTYIITFSNENGEPFSFNDSNITINGNVIESDENRNNFV